MAVQSGLCRTWSQTPNTGFLTTNLISERIPLKLYASTDYYIRMVFSLLDTQVGDQDLQFLNEQKREFQLPNVDVDDHGRHTTVSFDIIVMSVRYRQTNLSQWSLFWHYEALPSDANQ